MVSIACLVDSFWLKAEVYRSCSLGLIWLLCLELMAARKDLWTVWSQLYRAYSKLFLYSSRRVRISSITSSS